MGFGFPAFGQLTQLHGKYYEACSRGKLFVAHAIVTAPGLYSTAAGTGGPLLWNGNAGINANIVAVGFGVTVVSTVAAALGLTGATGQTAAPTSTTAIDSSGCLKIGGAASLATPYRIGTVTTPGSFFLPLGQLHTGALTVDTGGVGWMEIAGGLLVPPNCWCSLAASAVATSTVMQAALIWEEVPV